MGSPTTSRAGRLQAIRGHATYVIDDVGQEHDAGSQKHPPQDDEPEDRDEGDDGTGDTCDEQTVAVGAPNTSRIWTSPRASPGSCTTCIRLSPLQVVPLSPPTHRTFIPRQCSLTAPGTVVTANAIGDLPVSSQFAHRNTSNTWPWPCYVCTDSSYCWRVTQAAQPASDPAVPTKERYSHDDFESRQRVRAHRADGARRREAALAHAKVSPPVVVAKTAQVFTLAVPTEKEGATTTTVELTPPSGFSIDSFVPSPGWKRTVQKTGPARMRSSRR